MSAAANDNDGIRFRSASPRYGAQFDLTHPHTYVLVTTSADRVAVLLDEGCGNEDFVFDSDAGRADEVDAAIRRAERGDPAAIRRLRWFAEFGVRRLREMREQAAS